MTELSTRLARRDQLLVLIPKLRVRGGGGARGGIDALAAH